MKACLCDDYRDAPTDFPSLIARCEQTPQLEATLDRVALDSTAWGSVERCRVCGALWAREYPFSEYHGGGSAFLYRITTDDPSAWLRFHAGLSIRIRTEHEEAAFLGSLGPESGPEPCRHPGCMHLRIAHSVLCRAHHAASINALRH